MHIAITLIMPSLLFLLPCLAFGEQPLAADHLELQPLMAEVLKKNPEIIATRQQYQAAAERIPQARTLPDPTLGVHLWNFPESFDLPRTQNTIIGLSQKFPFPGKLRLGADVAGRAADIAAQALRSKEFEVVARLKQTYFDLFLAHRDLQLHHEHVDLLKQLFEVATAKFRTGKGSQVDVLKAQVELSNLYQRLPVLMQRRETLEAKLNVLLDRDPQSPLGRPRDPVVTVRTRSLEELEQLAIDTRPELRAAQFAIQRGQQARALARRQYYPDFQVTFERFQNFQAPDGFGAIGVMTLPFAMWTKPKYDAGVREAEASIAAAEAEARAWHNLTKFQIKDALARIQAQQQVADLYRTTILPQAEQNLDAARAGYRTGRNDFFDVIEAERALLEYRLAYYKALVERETHLAALEQVVGGLL